jgi:hypothetical protein
MLREMTQHWIALSRRASGHAGVTNDTNIEDGMNHVY